jgi:hypothetical protein
LETNVEKLQVSTTMCLRQDGRRLADGMRQITIGARS